MKLGVTCAYVSMLIKKVLADDSNIPMGISSSFPASWLIVQVQHLNLLLCGLPAQQLASMCRFQLAGKTKQH